MLPDSGSPYASIYIPETQRRYLFIRQSGIVIVTFKHVCCKQVHESDAQHKRVVTLHACVRVSMCQAVATAASMEESIQ